MKKEYVTPRSLVVEQSVEFYLLAYSHVKNATNEDIERIKEEDTDDDIEVNSFHLKSKITKSFIPAIVLAFQVVY